MVAEDDPRPSNACISDVISQKRGQAEPMDRSHTNVRKQEQQQRFRGNSMTRGDSRGPFHGQSAGSRVSSDKESAAAVPAHIESVEALRKRLDAENFAALFDPPVATVLMDDKDNVNLMHTKTDGAGRIRGIWKGTIEVPKPNKTKKSSEASLLDMP